MIPWLARLLSKALISRGSKKTRRKCFYRPCLEALEDRLVPSVTSITGPGPDGVIPVGQNVQINIQTSDFTDGDTTDPGDQPFTYDINWNDGTADSTGTLAVSGDQLTGTTSHTLAQAVSTVHFTLNEVGEGPNNSGTEDVPINSNNVAIEINDTPNTSDNIVLYDPNQPHGIQTIQAKILNLTGADGTFRLQAISVGSGAVTFPENNTSVSIAAGQSTEITITPTAVSSEPFDVHINAYQGSTKVGEDDMTVVQVTIPDDIKNMDTPAGMPDRIPPTLPTTIHGVAVTPNLAGSGQFVTLTVNGQTNDNGRISFSGNSTLQVSSTGDIQISGTSQTEPGSAGQLHLVVQVHGQDTISSKNGFSVSAIPTSVSFTVYEYQAQGPFRGFIVLGQVVSDSGNPNDLNQVHFLEQVQVIARTGIFTKGGTEVQAIPITLNKGKFLDQHAVPLSLFNFPGGVALLYQTYVFRDTRTSTTSTYFPIANSGYIITNQEVLKGPFLFLTVRKFGASVTANGYKAGPGMGSAVFTTKRYISF